MEGKYSFKLSEESLEGKGCLKKPTGVYGIAGSTTEMSWWLVLAQVLSPLGLSHPFGLVTAMWRVPCSSPILCISLGPQGRNKSLCLGAGLAKMRISNLPIGLLCIRDHIVGCGSPIDFKQE